MNMSVYALSMIEKEPINADDFVYFESYSTSGEYCGSGYAKVISCTQHGEYEFYYRLQTIEYNSSWCEVMIGSENYIKDFIVKL